MTTNVEPLESKKRAIDPLPAVALEEDAADPSIRLCVANTTANTNMHTEQEIAPDIKVGRRPHLSIYEKKQFKKSTLSQHQDTSICTYEENSWYCCYNVDHSVHSVCFRRILSIDHI